MKLFNIFDTRILIWFHYVLLSFIVGGVLYFIPRTSIIFIKPFFDYLSWNFGIFIILFIALSISDQLIHSKYILNVD